jgi:hypothetical protein
MGNPPPRVPGLGRNEKMGEIQVRLRSAPIIARKGKKMPDAFSDHCFVRLSSVSHGYLRSGPFFRGGVFVRAEKKHSANVCNPLVKIMLCLERVFSFTRGFWKKHSLPWERRF